MPRLKLTPGTFGSVRFDDGDGCVVARIRVRRIDGTYVRLSRSGRTKLIAEKAVTEAATEASRAYGVSSGLTPSSTLAALVEDWHASEIASAVLRPQSLAKEYWSAKRLLVPMIGTVSIRELTVPICEQAYRRCSYRAVPGTTAGRTGPDQPLTRLSAQ